MLEAAHELSTGEVPITTRIAPPITRTKTCTREQTQKFQNATVHFVVLNECAHHIETQRHLYPYP